MTRSVAFLSKLLEADVEIRFVDLPSIEGATGRFLLQQMASVAELEAGMIGERTKRALAAAKDRGKKLGGFRGRAATADDRARASAALTARANEHATSLAPIIRGSIQTARYRSERSRLSLLPKACRRPPAPQYGQRRAWRG